MRIHNRRLRGWALVAFVVGAALIVGFGPPDGPLAFEDDRPLPLTWEEAEEASVGVVRNVGENQLTGLRATLEEFDFKVDEESPDREVLSLTLADGDAAAFTLDAGDATTITIRATDNFTPDEGEYKGLLIVWGEGPGLIRREITVSVPAPETNLVAPESAVGDVVLTGTLGRTDADTGDPLTVDLDDKYLPLKPAETDKTLDLPPKDTFIGIVYSEGHLGRVYVDGEKEEKEGVALLPIRVEIESPGTVGTYSGNLDLTGTGNDEEAIKTTVTVTHPEVKGAVDDPVLLATRNGPFCRTVNLNDPYLPLKPPIEEEILPPFEKAKPIGIVHSEGHYASVYLNGKLDRSQEKQGMIRLPVRVENLHRVGIYSGKLYVAGSDNEEGAVAVELKVTDSIWWAIAASVFGLVLGIVTKCYIDRWRPSSDLRLTPSELKKSYQGAYAVFKAEYPAGKRGYSFAKYRLNEKEIAGYAEQFGEALRAYGGSHLFFDVESDDYNNLVNDRKKAEEDVHHIGHGDDSEMKSPFGDSLLDLQTKLEELATFLNNKFPGTAKKPAFVASAAALVDPPDGNEELAVGTAQRITTNAQGYVDLIKDWRDMAIEVKQYLLWASRIKAHPNITPPDVKLLEQAKAKVEHARENLFDCTDASFLSPLGTAEGLMRYDQLAYLGSRYDEPKPTREEVENLRVKARRHTLAGWLAKELRFPRVWPEAAVKIEQTIRWVGDAVAIGLAVAIAIVTVLAARYFDKTFGQNWEYVTLILIGAMAETVAKGVTDRLAQLWRTRIS